MTAMHVNGWSVSAPWRVPTEEAWHAYAAGTVPVGAAIVDSNGSVVARARNRIFDGPVAGQLAGTRLAHAEVNAILGIPAGIDPRGVTLLTTAEPCPLCVGAIVIANIRRVWYGSREPFAGSAPLFASTPYVRSKEIAARGPEDPLLEAVLIVLSTEFHLRATGPRVAELVALSAALRPEAVALGDRLFRTGEWQRLRALTPDEGVATIAQLLD